MLTLNLKKDSAATAHVVVRMDKVTYKRLREYMHANDGENVMFPNDVKLVYRSMGWYKLVPARAARAFPNLMFAMKLIKRFAHDCERADIAEHEAVVAATVWPMPISMQRQNTYGAKQCPPQVQGVNEGT